MKENLWKLKFRVMMKNAFFTEMIAKNLTFLDLGHAEEPVELQVHPPPSFKKILSETPSVWTVITPLSPPYL